jgi:hypothetical protein
MSLASNPDAMFANFKQQAEAAGENMNNIAATADLTDANEALRFQQAAFKYNTAISASSSYIDLLKRLVSGIIQKI